LNFFLSSAPFIFLGHCCHPHLGTTTGKITTMLGAFAAWSNHTMCDPFVGLKSKQSIIKRTLCSHANINVPTFDRLVSILFQLIAHLYVHLYIVICLMNVIIIQHLSKSDAWHQLHLTLIIPFIIF
jgi:hypothetical protein